MKPLRSILLVGALLGACTDPPEFVDTEQALEGLAVSLAQPRVVLTPGGSAKVRIELVRDGDLPVELGVEGPPDLEVALSHDVVTTKPATLTVRASSKASAQEVPITLTAKLDGMVAETKMLVSVQVPTKPVPGFEQFAPGVVGEPRTFVIEGLEIPAEVIDGVAIAHGDMVLGEVNALEAQGALFSATCNYGFHTDFTCSPWSGGVIGYDFANNWGSEAENLRMRTVILEAIAEWELQTGLRFVRRNTGEWLQFRNGSGCSSTVGRAVITGFDSQSIALHPDCGTKGIVMHEIGHAIGLYHEQCRNDRDDFVTVDFGRVQDGLLHNFFQWGEALRDRGPYDFRSIMHYERWAFARDVAACMGGDLGQCTVRPHDPAMLSVIGQRSFLSEGDILGAYLLYPPSYTIAGAAPDAIDDQYSLFLRFDGEAPRADRFVWTSDRRPGVVLGTGHAVSLRAADLPAGTNVITASLVINGTTVTSRSLSLRFANAAPTVALAATDGRTTQDLDRWFTMAATVSDPEDGACPAYRCRYSWSPAPTTGATDQATATYRFSTVGPHPITVRVEDAGGAVTTRTASIVVVNSPPVATIVRPAGAITVTTGSTISLEGRATDFNAGTLACSSLRWQSSNPADTFSATSGCFPRLTLGATGVRTISLVATDPQGLASAPATVAVDVRACSGTCGPSAYATMTPDWTYGGRPVFYRESTVPLRVTISHSLAPAGNPVAYRVYWRRGATTHTITSGDAVVSNPTRPRTFDVTWPVGAAIGSWSLCDSPPSYRDYDLVVEATDSAGVSTTQVTPIKVGCALL